MVGWHREFISGLSGILEPIYKIMKEERKRKEWRKQHRGSKISMPESLKGKWFWSEECKNAKEAVLKEMKKDVLLHRTDESGILYIYMLITLRRMVRSLHF